MYLLVAKFWTGTQNISSAVLNFENYVIRAYCLLKASLFVLGKCRGTVLNEGLLSTSIEAGIKLRITNFLSTFLILGITKISMSIHIEYKTRQKFMYFFFSEETNLMLAVTIKGKHINISFQLVLYLNSS